MKIKRTKSFISIFLISIIVILFFVVSLSKKESPQYQKNVLVENEEQKDLKLEKEIKDSIFLGKQWIANFQKEEGLFNYVYFPEKDKFSEADNMVRQIGTFYGFLKLTETDFVLDEDEKVIENFRKGIQEYIKYDEIEGIKIAYIENKKGVAKINSQAVYVLSLAQLKKMGFELTEREKDDLEKIINGIKLMQADDGGFWYVYYLDEKDNKITPYGSGEVLYALVYYYKYIDKDKELLDLAKKHFSKFYPKTIGLSFIEENNRSFYSWVLYYLCELEEIEPGQFKYIKALIEKMLDYRENNYRCHDSSCIMRPFNMAESSFLEGTARAYNIIKKNNPELASLVYDYLRKSVKDILKMQVKSKEDFRDKYHYDFKADDKIILGSFCGDMKNCEKIRNDFAQHSLSGLIYFLEID
jgi:hypothetical protein